MTDKNNKMISFWKFTNTKSKEMNKNYKSELIQMIIHNLAIVSGPMSQREIYRYFNVTRGGRKILSKNIRYLTEKKFGSDPIMTFSNRKYCLNDEIKE